MALYPYTINPYMVYEPQALLGFISSLRLKPLNPISADPVSDAVPCLCYLPKPGQMVQPLGLF